METSPQRVDLESKIGFLEQTVDALNEMVVQQGRSLEELERRFERFRLRYGASGGEDESHALADERPPHY